MTLKDTGRDVLQACYSPERQDRVVLRTKEFLDPIFPIIENKAVGNLSFLECATETLHGLLNKYQSLYMKELRKPILEIFN